MGKARLKWSIFYAELKGSKVQIKRSANRRGEGLMMPETIERRILPNLDEWKIQLPIAIKTYYSVKPSGIDITVRGGKPVFTPASPKEDTVKFSYYIDENQAIFKIGRGMKIPLSHLKEAIEACDEVITRFISDIDPVLQEQVAMALSNKVAALDLLARFGSDTGPEMREQIANALLYTGFVLGKLKRQEEAIDAYDEVVTRFGSDADPVLRKLSANALLLGGSALDKLNRREEAIDTYNEVVTRWGSDTDPELRELVANALVLKGNDLTELSKQR